MLPLFDQSRIKMKTLILLLFVSLTAHADVWLPSIFSDGMVLQADKPVMVWGEAEVGEEVSVEFAGQVKNARADANKHWQVQLEAMPVSADPRNLTVRSQLTGSTIQLAEVRVGEVWILAGQSNMGWPLANCTGGNEAATQADFPWLKIFKQWPFQGASDEPARDVTGGQWVTCDPQQAQQLSGVGFFFARALQQSLPVGTPIALINTQMGGTYAECWIDFKTLGNTPSAAPFLEKAANEVVPGGTDPDGFWGTDNFRRPAALYNGKVAPLQLFGVRGVIWYQGEGNTQAWLAPGYVGTLTALIESWRAGFEQSELPFFVVQLPRYDAGQWNDWPAVRAAQQQVANEISGVEIAVTIDLGEENQIHPADKESVGERLALLARTKVHGESIESSGPVFHSVEVDGGDVFVEWAFAEGLVFSNGKAQGFEICGTNGIFVSAEAEILSGGRVRVFSAAVPEPIGARYGWFNWGDVSLFNASGLPAAPFSWTANAIYLKAGTDGNLYANANWIGDVLPVTDNGLVGTVDGSEVPLSGTFTIPTNVYDMVLQQEGGTCATTSDLNLRGGATNEIITVPGKTLWTIDDQLNDPTAYINLYVPSNLVIWSHMGGEIELNLLRGRIEVGGTFKMPAYGKGILNIRDGIFRSQFFKASSAAINLMAGGTAEVDLGQLETADRNVVFNFESGFKGSVTISQTEIGLPFRLADWQALADAGKITMDGVSVGLDFLRVSNGGTTLQHISTLPGLAVVGGTLYKKGVPYRAVGVNYCDAFQRMVADSDFTTLDGIEILGERGIPFARFWACGFWPADWDLYFADKAEWFRRMDMLVQTAEEAEVGLIPSIFWRISTYPELMGETRDQIANPDSDTWQFMSNYVHEVIGRYKDSPAIWGWEFGNELNNMCDLPNWTTGLGTVIEDLGVVGPATEVNESNKFTYAIAETAFGLFTQEVRKLDTHRFISNGNSRPRKSAWHNRMANSFGQDNYAEAKEAFGWMQPASIDMASVHVYPYSMEDSNGDIVYADVSGLANVLLRYREFCDDQNQAMFVGEYSSFFNGQGPPPEEERIEEAAFLEAILASGADLAAFWVYDRGIDRTEVGTIYPSTGEYMGVLDLISEYDAEMRGETWTTTNGVPPAWFELYGIVPTNWQTWAEIEVQDLNGNGMPLWQDYLVGFHPLESRAVFAITDFQWVENSLPRLSWHGGTSGLLTPYVIQSTTDLQDSTSWQTVGSEERQQGINTWTGSAIDDARRFFRILVTLE
jgi:sialate O-acetylesterase